MQETDGYAVIMAGGNGERFWPLSTQAKPKQFLSIIGGKALLTLAVERLQGLFPPERILIITAARLVPATRDAAPDIPAENIIGEPCKRDTAAAVASACGLVRRKNPDAVVCILTADQLMEDAVLFRQTLRDSMAVAAAQDGIVTIGITPTYPATGFGYIQVGDPLPAETVTGFHAVKRFVEKPDVEKATAYLNSGEYFWNAGMFIWKTSVMQRALETFTPELARLSDELAAAQDIPAALAVMDRIYPGLTRISIDYAIMERVDHIFVASGCFGWDDVGSWSSISEHLPSDEQKNVVIGECESIDSSDNLVISNNRLTALIGCSGLAVIQTNGVTLICPKARAQQVKQLLRKVETRPDAAEYL